MTDMETYAVDMRYPDLGFDPSREAALAALALSKEVVSKIRANLPIAQNRPSSWFKMALDRAT
jgi:hypothetical protein